MPEPEIQRLAARLSQQPQSPLFARLADYYLAGDRTDEALALCERGVREHPSYAGGHIVLGKCLTRAGRVREARLAFHAALDLAPYNTVVQNLLISLPDVKDEEAAAVSEPAPPHPAAEPDAPPVAASEVTPERPTAPDVPESLPQQPTTAPEPEHTVSAAAPDAAQGAEAVTHADVLSAAPPPDAAEPQFEPYPTFEEYLAQHPAPERVMTLEEYLKGRTANASSASSAPAAPLQAAPVQAETPTDFESIALRLQNAGRIVPVDHTLAPPSPPASALSDAASGTQSSTIVTQTMAEIYAAQNEFQAAIDAYEELIKKQPEQAKAFQQRIDAIRLLMGTV